MKISVIIPAYKAQNFIERCIDAISKQTVRPDEILIGVDACQATLDKCREIAETNDKIKLFYFPEHSGCYRIRNTMAMIAQGELLVLFDADDAMHENYIEEMQKLARKGTLCRPRFINNNKGKINQNRVPAEGCVSIMKTDLIDNAGWEPWRCAADSEFNERALRRGMKRTQTEGVVFVRYIHDGNLTRNTATDMKSAYRKSRKAEILKRRELNFTRDTIAVSRCIKVDENIDANIRIFNTKEVAINSASIEIIVPMPHKEDTHRLKLWEYCKDKWVRVCDYQITEVEPIVEDGLYCKCATLNKAIKQSSSDYLIIADADIIPTADIIKHIKESIAAKEKFIMPHRTVARFNQETTDKITRGKEGDYKGYMGDGLNHKEHQAMPCGGLLVVNRRAIINIGLYNEQIKGWGGDDYELSIRIGKQLHKGNSKLLHLWHEPQQEKDMTSSKNLEIVHAMQNAAKRTTKSAKIRRHSRPKTIWVGNTRKVIG